MGFCSNAGGSHWRVLSRGDISGLTQSKHLPVWELTLSLFPTQRRVFAGRECRKENSANVSMEVNVEARILFYNETCFEMPGVHSQPIPESLGGFQLTGAVMKVALISLSLSCLN